jgi:hypothetical protein
MTSCISGSRYSFEISLQQVGGGAENSDCNDEVASTNINQRMIMPDISVACMKVQILEYVKTVTRRLPSYNNK